MLHLLNGVTIPKLWGALSNHLARDGSFIPRPWGERPAPINLSILIISQFSENSSLIGENCYSFSSRLSNSFYGRFYCPHQLSTGDQLPHGLDVGIHDSVVFQEGHMLTDQFISRGGAPAHASLRA
jgi:hypothetical protein